MQSLTLLSALFLALAAGTVVLMPSPLGTRAGRACAIATGLGGGVAIVVLGRLLLGHLLG